MARGEIGLQFGLPRKRALAFAEDVVRRHGLGACGLQSLGMALHRLAEGQGLRLETRDSFRPHRRSAPSRRSRSRASCAMRRLERSDLLGGASGLGIDAVALDIKPLQHGGRDRVLLPGAGASAVSAASRASEASRAGFLGPGRIGKRRAQDLFGRKSRVASASRQRSHRSSPSAARSSAPISR